MKNYILFSLVFILSCSNPSSEVLITNKDLVKDDRTEIVLLGTWHFSNPGQDEYNTTSDNFFAPKRQKEINELNKRLAAFNPDKIFLENSADYQIYFDSLYTIPNFDFKTVRNGHGVNEAYQIGYKLGKILNHEKVYGADADGLWLGSAVNEVAKEQHKDLESKHTAKMKSWVKYSDDLMKKSSIKDIMISMNHPDSIIKNNEYYIDYAVQIIDQNKQEGSPLFAHTLEGEKEERLAGTFDQKYIGAELVAEWYKRNIKIYSKILEQTNPEDKRIFVLFGAGHIRILRHLFEDNPNFKIVEVNEYLKG